METDLLGLIREDDPDLEQAWRDFYHAWTFPFAIAHDRCWVNGYALCPSSDDIVEMTQRVDQICAGVIVRGVTERYGSREVLLLTEFGGQWVPLAELGADLDAVKIQEES